MTKRIKWKTIISDNGLSNVLKNPLKYVPKNKYVINGVYNQGYIDNLIYRLLRNHSPYNFIKNGKSNNTRNIFN